ncbi:transglycosylase domain-containing protein [Aminipila sp.]|uniref:transglycosylase domain-containing protein n=2 Tax=Aminipila sp. TaxID=2060095 RepID=UPI0028982E52|nr:transglycosylase domain-containing protein [Aminipila sp.]
MSDENNKKNETSEDKLRKIDEFFNQFEEKTNNDPTNVEDFLLRFNEMEKQQQTEKEEIEARRKTRMDRLNEKKNNKQKREFLFNRKASTILNNEENNMEKNTANTANKKKKHKLNLKKFILFLFGLCLLGGVVLGGLVLSIIIDAPKINPNNIYSLLSESSTLYDDQENVIDNLTSFSSEGTRTNVEYSELPQNLVDAFISIEDKTFLDHHGFNFVRILGAIRDSFTSGKISGTSTITQQLARNLYLTETRTERTLTRKIKEAYYTVLLEKHLTKEEIIEAYLNTIYLGYNSYGVQAASQAYFSKDVEDLDILECAALASLPQAPDSYAIIKKIYPENITDPNSDNILLKSNVFYYVYNDISASRRETCLKLMNEQGFISDSELSDALADNLKDHLKPSSGSTSEFSSYFADYVVEQVTAALVEEGMSEEAAKRMIYTGGLKIQTTLNSQMQKIAENEFSNNKNFPNVANLKKDKSGNIISDSGSIMLYNYNTYFQSNGDFTLNSDEYKKNSDGSLTIYKGKRLKIYNVEVREQIDCNLEFKDTYTIEDGIFYSIGGSIVAIPAEYKTRDADGNLVISEKLFKDMPKIFKSTSKGLAISSDYYTLKQKVVQPQSAMVISDPYTGSIKVMVGGRNTVGRLLHNRATGTRQPGSSIKPIGVYGPALQASVDALNSGTTLKFSDSAGVSKLFGDYFTAASVIDDTPLIVQGKQWPKNWYSGYRGLHTLRASIEQSVNVNAVRVFQQLGVQKSVSFLKKVGVSTIVESGNANDLNAAALALGGMTKGISPLEMSAAYSAFVNDGKYTKPMAFTKVTNNRGEVILENTPQSTQVMDPGVAFIMRDMLRTTVTHGIGSRAGISNQPVGGKTGTTTDNYDAWFVGFTPQYSAAVWIGNDVNIELSQGSASAARLWSNIMGQVCAKLPTESYRAKPSNVISVTIDTKSGKLPSSLSALDPRGNTIRSEYFIKGTEPKTTDNVHTSVTVCAESGYLATPACHATKTVVGVKRPYTVSSAVGDINYEVPHYYCNLHNPDTAKYPVNPSGKPNSNFNGTESPGNSEENGENNSNNNNGNNGNSGNNGNGNTSNGNNNPSSPNDGNTDENGNSTIPDWLLPH